MRKEPNLRYKRNQKELRGRKKVTENAVRRQNRVDHNQEFD